MNILDILKNPYKEQPIKELDDIKTISHSKLNKKKDFINNNNKNICYICFKKPYCLRKHIRTHGINKNKSKTFDCNICNRKFYVKNSLKRHKLFVHNIGDIKWYKCELCPKKFRTLYHLNRHKDSHKRYDIKFKNYKYKCPICNKPIKVKRNVKRHIAYTH
tara:strand:+ start:6776 stop:7258 length:483 start_codon:yes stop_codon:yes gene_type:complete